MTELAILTGAILLWVEIGFFHGVVRKTFRGLTHRRMWATLARFIGAKTKGCPQVPDVSPMTRWLSSDWLQKFKLWGLRPAPSPVRSRRARTQRGRLLCLISLSVSRQGLMVPGAERESVHTRTSGFVKLWLYHLAYISSHPSLTGKGGQRFVTALYCWADQGFPWPGNLLTSPDVRNEFLACFPVEAADARCVLENGIIEYFKMLLFG